MGQLAPQQVQCSAVPDPVPVTHDLQQYRCRARAHNQPVHLYAVECWSHVCTANSCRPSVPANSPLVFDVQLLYIPGKEESCVDLKTRRLRLHAPESLFVSVAEP